MARARNIKAAFFTNDELAELEPIERLFFIGLWTIADFKGDIEWRPKKIKALIMPYDNINPDLIAINLDKSGFIRFYSNGDKMFIRVVNFSIHQNPHKNEKDKGSNIPEYSEKHRQAVDIKGLAINPDKIAIKSDEIGSNPADSLILIPDSLILIPDPLNLPTPIDKKSISDCFDLFWESGIRKAAKKTLLQKFTTVIKKLSKQKNLSILEATLFLVDDIKKRLEVDQLGFIGMLPTTYLNGERWNDEIKEQTGTNRTNYETATDRARKDTERLIKQQGSTQDAQTGDSYTQDDIAF